MSWEGPDPERDEDRYYEDESMVPAALLRTEPLVHCICRGACELEPWCPKHAQATT